MLQRIGKYKPPRSQILNVISVFLRAMVFSIKFTPEGKKKSHAHLEP
jgi:hypothetical protein